MYMYVYTFIPYNLYFVVVVYFSLYFIIIMCLTPVLSEVWLIAQRVCRDDRSLHGRPHCPRD